MKKTYWLLVFLIIAFIFLIFKLFFYHHYTIFVDAGSNGSRLFIYEYTGTKKNPVIHNVFTDSTVPGLSSYASNPQAAANSLDPLLDHAKYYLYTHLIFQSAVKINILATAGMRLLPLTTQQIIYDSILQNVKKNYQFKLGEFRTITGKEEGLYGWLDINYLARRFQRNLPTFGSIDMGGASSQIAFETDDITQSNDFFIFTLNKKQVKVFSRSFQGLGNVQSLLIMNKSSQARNCYPKNYPLSNTLGRFNFKNCEKIFETYILTFPINTLNLMLKDKIFVAYSAIYHTVNFFDVVKLSDQNILKDKIQSVCNNEWGTVQKLYPTVNIKYLSSACAMGVYINELLYDTYQLKSEQLIVVQKIRQKDINWTLGKMLFDLIDHS